MAANPTTSVTLVVFVLVALTVSRLSSRVTNHAREAESRGGQMEDLYEFTRRTLQMDLHVEPGPQLAELVHEIFALKPWRSSMPICTTSTRRDSGMWNHRRWRKTSTTSRPRTTILRVELGAESCGSERFRSAAWWCGKTSPLTNNAIASLIAITFDRYRAFANESRIETERRTEQLRATVLDSLAHAYKTPLTAIRAAATGLVEMGRLSPGRRTW